MLLERIEKHLKGRRIPPTRFGREAVGDPKFVFQLREGREPRSSTVKRVLDYLDDQEALFVIVRDRPRLSAVHAQTHPNERDSNAGSAEDIR